MTIQRLFDRFAAEACIRTLAIVLAFALGTVAGGAEELSPKELKKLDRSAGKALKAGRHDEAAELYQQLLDATPAGDERREDALWTVAMVRLSSDPNDEAPADYLRELADSFPRHPRKLELIALRSVLAALEETRTESDKVRAELEERLAAFEKERQEIEQEQEKIVGDTEDRVRALESQLRRVRGELAATKEELEKKEEALQRLLRLRSERGSG